MSEAMDIPTEEDLNDLLILLEGISIENRKAVSILRFIVLKGHVTKNILKSQFSLSDRSELRPLLALLQGRGLLKTGRGYYPTSMMIQYVRFIDEMKRYQF